MDAIILKENLLALWMELAMVLDQHTYHWILLGDFKMIEHGGSRCLGNLVSGTKARAWACVICKLKLIDANVH